MTKICCFDCWRPSSRKIRELDVTSAQDSGRDPQPGTAFFPKSEPPAKRVVCSGPVRACYRLRLKTLAFTLFKPSALAALATP